MPKYTDKPYPSVGQTWERVSRRYLKKTVIVKVIKVDSFHKVYLEVKNPQFKQKLFPVMSVKTFLHEHTFKGRE